MNERKMNERKRVTDLRRLWIRVDLDISVCLPMSREHDDCLQLWVFLDHPLSQWLIELERLVFGQVQVGSAMRDKQGRDPRSQWSATGSGSRHWRRFKNSSSGSSCGLGFTRMVMKRIRCGGSWKEAEEHEEDEHKEESGEWSCWSWRWWWMKAMNHSKEKLKEIKKVKEEEEVARRPEDPIYCWRRKRRRENQVSRSATQKHRNTNKHKETEGDLSWSAFNSWKHWTTLNTNNNNNYYPQSGDGWTWN